MKSILASLGIIHGSYPTTHVITPYADGLKAFEAFLATAATPGAKLRTMIYGCTIAPYFDALISAKKAHCDIRVIFDHTQSAGRAERPQIQRLVDAGFIDGTDFLIGTSPDQHQIVHLKLTMIHVPTLTPIVEHGSWNYSVSASKQLNDLCFTESQELAGYAEHAFDLLWAWIAANETTYQAVTRQ